MYFLATSVDIFAHFKLNLLSFYIFFKKTRAKISSHFSCIFYLTSRILIDVYWKIRQKNKKSI